jgi:hypothetical protein
MELQRRTFPAPKRVKDFKTITIREVTGEDEMTAAAAAEAKSAQYNKGWSPQIELIKLSVVEVDGKPVNTTAPFDAFDKWLTPSRNAVMKFFDQLNSLDEQDLKACLAVAAATGQTPKTTTPVDPSTAAPSGG